MVFLMSEVKYSSVFPTSKPSPVSAVFMFSDKAFKYKLRLNKLFFWLPQMEFWGPLKDRPFLN